MATILATHVPSLASPNPIAKEAINAEGYEADYAAHHYEWVDGNLIKMSPISLKHDDLTIYLQMLFKAYFALRPIGVILREPFLLPLPTGQRREPDLQVVFNAKLPLLTQTAMIGPSDICIEVVSQESVERDHGEKFREYESNGVCEYWIIDPLRSEGRVYRLNEDGVYIPYQPDSDGHYSTPLLPGLQLHVPTLWQAELPSFFQIGNSVQAMLSES